MPIRTLPTEQYFAIIKEQLALSGTAYVRVTGVSMHPMLCHLRDSVILVPPTRIRVGDIVLFERGNGRYALHRVILKTGRGFYMAGDNQWHYEANLPYAGIVGVASHIVRDGKTLDVRRFPQVLFAAFITAAAFPRIFVYRMLRSLYRPLARLFGGNPTVKKTEKRKK